MNQGTDERARRVGWPIGAGVAALMASVVLLTPSVPADAAITEDWVRKARVVSVTDGDTLVLAVDLGYKMTFTDKFRLAGVDTPEVWGVKKTSDEYKAGKKASAFTKQWIVDNDDSDTDAYGNIYVKSGKDTGKYGRWIAWVYPASGEEKTLNQALLDSGNAKPYNGGKR